MSDDIGTAHAALLAAGFTHDQALLCLEALTDAGLLVMRPQTMLDRVVDAALKVQP